MTDKIIWTVFILAAFAFSTQAHATVEIASTPKAKAFPGAVSQAQGLFPGYKLDKSALSGVSPSYPTNTKKGVPAKQLAEIPAKLNTASGGPIKLTQAEDQTRAAASHVTKAREKQRRRSKIQPDIYYGARAQPNRSHTRIRID
jgi:hypothetical protein